ncbi:MAG: hypothetical protein E7655_04040 [Ruminococcaceae bacterium]|nr:hypothetical protein [Oscillospiraceae bacterium]
MEYLVGLDIGTSSVKGVLMSRDGKVATVKTKKHNYYWEDKFKLLNAEDFCENCFSVIKEISDTLSEGDNIAAVCVSGAGGNLMLVKDGKSCSPVYGWQTFYDDEITNKTLSKMTKPVYDVVGWPSKLKTFPLAALAYLKGTNPEAIENADTVCMHIEYLSYKLTGAWGITRSMGTTFFLIDQEKGEYYQEYLDMLGLRKEQLLPILPNCSIQGRVNAYAAEKTGLKEGTPVIPGTFDHPSAARGAGVMDENNVMVSCGTSWVVFIPYATRQIPFSKGMLIDPFMAPEGNWCGMKSMPSVSETIDKYMTTFLGDISVKEFDKLAAESSLGCNGLVIEDENTDVSGYSRPDIARAIMENIARRLKEFFEVLDVKTDTVKLVGGITNSKPWCDVVAEITGKKVLVVNGEHAGAIGSAIMAGVGVGFYPNEKDAFNSMGFTARES